MEKESFMALNSCIQYYKKCVITYVIVGKRDGSEHLSSNTCTYLCACNLWCKHCYFQESQ